MKFVDEADISVRAGDGGGGCLSFRREKYVEYGGPDGGNGGHGGSVILLADGQINTLVDFRYVRHYKADNGQPGRGRNCTGAKGGDLEIRVPVGTSVIDTDADEELADLSVDGQRFMVAAGGKGGAGNASFKSSTNRAPRQTKPGTPGESRHLRLELKVLADVGLLGLPNAGKSTLVSVMSAAKPKVANYPFTTLVPSLGVVRVDPLRSFVMADIPGLISGAAEGLGLGTRFLRHLARNRLLLHLVDINPIDESDLVDSVSEIETELHTFSEALAEVPRWLVCTKADTLEEREAQNRMKKLVRDLNWDGPVFLISALSRQGCDELAYAVMEHLEQVEAQKRDDETFAYAEADRWRRVQADLRRVANERSQRKRRQKSECPKDDDDLMEVEYVQ